MALNRTDTRQRAYNRLDVCSPQGHWIDEPQFSKSSSYKGVRVGNWQEEQHLVDSMDTVKARIPKQPLASEERRGKAVRRVPNSQSSLFLINSELDPTSHFESTHTAFFKGAQPAPQPIGVRQQLVHREIISAALRTESAPAASEHSWAKESSKVGMSLPKIKPRSHPNEEDDSFLREVPITVYADPYTASHFTGATSATGDNPMKRNTNFSKPLAEYNKAKSPLY
eukprot:TRINITY_DN5561_c0_g1_i1.p1 TRINITY_DN5561_c0_g1~~TRINITY_DN5561_c0_g1_i1.p1  ORF type:complete len:226 (+),score=47.29 TRINITY_DN5561_c0_g1_i1:201-878(+)